MDDRINMSRPNCVAPNGANIWRGAYHRGFALSRCTPAYNLPPLSGLISGTTIRRFSLRCRVALHPCLQSAAPIGAYPPRQYDGFRQNNLLQKTFVITYPMGIQKRFILFHETLNAMMLLLVPDVIYHMWNNRRTDRERAITRLPRKHFVIWFQRLKPTATLGLEGPHQVGKSNSLRQ